MPGGTSLHWSAGDPANGSPLNAGVGLAHVHVGHATARATGGSPSTASRTSPGSTAASWPGAAPLGILEYRTQLLAFDFLRLWHGQFDGVLFGEVGRVFIDRHNLSDEFRLDRDIVSRVV